MIEMDIIEISFSRFGDSKAFRKTENFSKNVGIVYY